MHKARIDEVERIRGEVQGSGDIHALEVRVGEAAATGTRTCVLDHTLVDVHTDRLEARVLARYLECPPSWPTSKVKDPLCGEQSVPAFRKYPTCIAGIQGIQLDQAGQVGLALFYNVGVMGGR